MPAEIEFESLSFEEENNYLVVTLLNIFYFKIPKIELKKIGNYKIKLNKEKQPKIIEFQVPQNKAENKFSFLITNRSLNGGQAHLFRS